MASRRAWVVAVALALLVCALPAAAVSRHHQAAHHHRHKPARCRHRRVHRRRHKPVRCRRKRPRPHPTVNLDQPPQPFELGVQGYSFLQPANVPTDLAAMQTIDGSWVRLLVRWSLLVPQGSLRPLFFHEADLSDSHYRWEAVDAFMRMAASNHLNVIMTPLGAPLWAQGPNRPNKPDIGPAAWDPNATDFGEFMHAFAERYSGHFRDPRNKRIDLPRVQYWEIWNEENLPLSLAAPDVVSEYRSLLNAAYDSVKGVDPTNVVIVGGLSPVSANPPDSMAPLPFAAALMCLGGANGVYTTPLPCPVKPEFDAFGFHPYTLGYTPATHSPNPDEMFVSDTGRLTALLARADELGLALPSEPHPVWATEWGEFTDPPQPSFGVADPVAARYVAYSMYQLWRAGIPIVIWSTIQDPANTPGLSEEFIPGGGLYWGSGGEKLMGQAFAFPMVAIVDKRRAYYWGRVPESVPVQVLVQRAGRTGWATVATATTDSYGVFYISSRSRGQGYYRALVAGGGPVSLAYDSQPIAPGATHG